MFAWTHLAYYFLISLDCIILLFWLVKRSKQLQLPVVEALDLALILMLSSLAGARLFHVIYEEPEFYRNDLLRIFQLWLGGFVFYGGLISATVFGLLWIKYKKLDLLRWLDFFAPLGSFAYAFGRLSCVIAGCCYGREAIDLPWAVANRHPTQWYAVFWESIVLMILLVLDKKQTLKKGSLFFIWIFLHAVGRIVMELFRDDPRGNLIIGISIATWISLCLIVISIGFFGSYCRSKRLI